MLLNDTTRLSVTCLGRVANWMLGYCHFGGFIPDAVDHITPTCHRSAETLSYSLHRRDLPSGHRTLSYTASRFTEWRINNSNLFLWYWKQGEKQVFFGILGSWNSFGFMHDPQEFQPGENTKNVERGCFPQHGRKAVKWKHICVKRNGHSATCEPEAGTLHRRSRRRKVETGMWMGANGDNMEMENKCCCWRDAAKTSSHPCRMNMWFVLLKWTSTSGRFNIIYVNKEQNYWKKRTHKWKTVGRERVFLQPFSFGWHLLSSGKVHYCSDI